MPIIEVGIVYRFHADDADHAVELLIEHLDVDRQAAAIIRDNINVFNDLGE